ncbi:hypothetical protein [Pseudotenacibaculum haliotis]|uniref:Uncharacterized protein n=1 Tax=Pseudotenacibaculum haliotis TaxID=1862138 RepID=A0ABW5LPU9_9FLAO
MALILAVGFSCQQENELELENDLINYTTTSKAPPITNSSIDDPFEAQLQWVSFLTAKVIQQNPSARTQFMNLIGNINPDVVRLNDLLVDGSAFEIAFKHQFILHNGGNTDEKCPGGTKDPKGKPKPPGAIGGCQEGFCLDTLYQQYIEYLTQENCIEIFLPNGYVPTTILIYSTAHPLTNSNYNKGYILPEQCDGEITIYPFNLASLNNVLVARPYREVTITESGGSTSTCSYNEYSSIIDFTYFLNY